MGNSPHWLSRGRAFFFLLGASGLDAASTYDHAALAIPPRELEFAFNALEPLTAIHPTAFLLQCGDEGFDFCSLAQLEEVRDAPSFAFGHDALASVVAVPPDGVGA